MSGQRNCEMFTNLFLSLELNFTNPPRRDVAQLPGGGWLVIAYQTDNPGAWLMHCHIAFHVGNGLGVQFLERKSSITLPAANSEWYNTCQNWVNVSETQSKCPSTCTNQKCLVSKQQASLPSG